MKQYFQSVAILTGTIIGVGMFSVPFVIVKAGYVFLLIFLPLLGLVEYFLLLHYAEIILSTKDHHRLPGYAEKYLGKVYKYFGLVVSTLANSGAILAYIIIGGIFLNELLGEKFGGGILLYTTILFIVESFIVLFGLKLISKMEVYMTTLLVFVVGVIIYKAGSHIDVANYTSANLALAALPYGPIFFAVGGGSAVPEVCRLLAGDKKKIKSAILVGIVVPIFIIFAFVTAIIGVTGVNTTPDTLVGLNVVLGDELVQIALVFGVLAIVTSFLTIAQGQREIYWWDLKMDKTFAWALACGAPYLLFIAGIQDLTKVVSVTGAVSGGLVGVLLLMIALKVKKKRDRKPVFENRMNLWIAIVLSLAFIFGLVYELWEVFFNI